MPPKIAARHDRASGVLPVSAAARAASAKQPAARLKLEVRRLPPGLTLSEFEDTLGDEWRLNKGKVDWREYRQGKIKSTGKLPEQSRCYIHVTSDAAVKEFEQRFLAIVFHDKAGTHKLQELKFLPPTLGYAPNQRVPLLGRQRVDNRQGTIDQDPEFFAFLEAETQPIARTAALDSSSLEKEDGKHEVKSTPLIDDLREKKALRAKAAASKAEKKGHKRAESKEPAAAAKDAKGKDKIDSKKVEQVAKEATKVAGKTGGTKQAQVGSTASVAAVAASPAKKRRERQQASPRPLPAELGSGAAPTSPASQRAAPAVRTKRDAEGIRKMLQKDLGIKPKDAPVRTKGGTPASPSGRRAESASTQATVAPKAPAKASIAQSAEAPASSLRAFLKHANPSQGMTDVLIQEALSKFGSVSSVTIDQRKGTAIAVFTAAEGLQNAMAAKKVTVASGAVEVLEFKDRSASASASAPPKGTSRAPRRERTRAAAVLTATTAANTTPANVPSADTAAGA